MSYFVYFSISICSWDNCFARKWAQFCDMATEALDTECTFRTLLDEIQCHDVFLSRLPLLKLVTCSRLFVGWTLHHSVCLWRFCLLIDKTYSTMARLRLAYKYVLSRAWLLHTIEESLEGRASEWRGHQFIHSFTKKTKQKKNTTSTLIFCT